MGVMLSAAGSLGWLRGAARRRTTTSFWARRRAGLRAPRASSSRPTWPASARRTPTPTPAAPSPGSRLRHDRGALARAVLEGVAFGLRDSLELLAELGVEPDAGRVSGGGARSELWLRIVASVLGLPLERTAVEEGSAFGAALLGGVAAGVFGSAEEAVAACVRVRETVDPEPAWTPPVRRGIRSLPLALSRAEGGPMSLEGKVAVVTGASRGIGAAVARALAAEGVRLGLASRSGDDLGLADAVAQPCDVRDRAQVQALVDETAERFGRLDILVANAGVGAYGPLVDLRPDLLDEMIDVNVKGVLYAAAAAVPHLIAAGGGDLVSVASEAGRRGLPNEAVYCASKFAQVGFTRRSTTSSARTGSVARTSVPAESRPTSRSTTGRGRTPEALPGMMSAEDVAEAVMFVLTRPRGHRVLELAFRPVKEESWGIVRYAERALERARAVLAAPARRARRGCARAAGRGGASAPCGATPASSAGRARSPGQTLTSPRRSDEDVAGDERPVLGQPPERLVHLRRQRELLDGGRCRRPSSRSARPAPPGCARATRAVSRIDDRQPTPLDVAVEREEELLPLRRNERVDQDGRVRRLVVDAADLLLPVVPLPPLRVRSRPAPEARRQLRHVHAWSGSGSIRPSSIVHAASVSEPSERIR